MKKELIKYITPAGDVFYKTVIDGKYVEGSASMDLQTATKMFENITTKESFEVIKSIEI